MGSLNYYCYILECADGTYYTGWTTNPSRRIRQHNQGRGARYTRMHIPARLVYWEEVADRSAALKREVQLKTYSHQKKAKIIELGTPRALAAVPQASWLVTAPGRVNLLGEHVDYNGGAVLPAAINRFIQAAAIPAPDSVHEIQALDLGETVRFSNASLEERKDAQGNLLPAWAWYPAGVAWAALQRSLPVVPLKAAFSSTIPVGAGLSSSAAIEVAFGLVWKAAGRWKLDGMSLAQLCLKAEREYVGLNCGLMDQFACLFGREGHVLFFDTAALSWEALPIPDGFSLVVADSGIRHSLTHSGYNERRSECEEALALLQRVLDPVPASLAEITPEKFYRVSSGLPENLQKRARHVVEECARVKQAVELLRKGNMKAFGKLMDTGHASLRDLYEVSLPELDYLAQAAAQVPGCMGARLTGGGFGGCTINLVETSYVEAFSNQLIDRYHQQFGRTVAVLTCKPAGGAQVINLS